MNELPDTWVLIIVLAMILIFILFCFGIFWQLEVLHGQ